MIKMFNVNMPSSADKAVLDTLHSGMITQGPKVEEFEGRLSDLLGHNNVLTTNSCTAAITLALKLAGVGPGTEVISSPMTCSATNLPVLTLGGKIVWADIDPKTGNIDPESIEKLITKKTKAILFVDWGGQPAELDKIVSIARAHDLKTIQDAAHALRAIYKNNPITHYTDFTCFSFQAIKHITTGDGGALVCDNQDDYERAKLLRWFGLDRETGKRPHADQDIKEAGYKFHMNDIAATIGIEQLNFVETILQRHLTVARKYASEINIAYAAHPGPMLEGSWWLYTLLLADKKERNRFKVHMVKNGVEVSTVHKRNDVLSVFKTDKQIVESLKGVREFSDRMVCIPIHAGLTDLQVAEVISAAKKFKR